MNKRTRVLNAMDNKPVDRPPVGFWFHFTDTQGVGQACVDAHLDFYNHQDTDLVKIMCDNYFTFPVPEGIVHASDWKHMQPIDRNHPFIQEQVERAIAVKAGLNKDICVFYTVFAPFSSLRFGTSDELIMRHLREDPEAVTYALDIVAEANATLAERLISEAGCDGIYYCVQGGERDRFTFEEYRKWITPGDLRVLEHANRFSTNNILHCCGWAGIPNRMDCWQDYPAKAINWAVHVEGLSLAEGKSFFGGKCVLGGFDNRKPGALYAGSRETVREYTHQLMRGNGAIGLMIGADCTLPADIERERIDWVVEAVREAQ